MQVERLIQDHDTRARVLLEAFDAFLAPIDLLSEVGLRLRRRQRLCAQRLHLLEEV